MALLVSLSGRALLASLALLVFVWLRCASGSRSLPLRTLQHGVCGCCCCRLLGFDVETLYELHYQMITLGKVFCNKQAPNW
jgi:hypothetical protein